MKKTIEDFNQLKDAFIKKSLRPCILLDLVDKTPGIMDDKLGGTPFIPVDEELPKKSTGENLSLVMQIDLEHVDLENWPKSGILEVFFDDSHQYPNEWAVKLFDKSKPHQELQDMTTKMFDRPWGIKMTKGECYMPTSDFRFPETLAQIIFELYGDEIPKNRRGNIPFFGVSDYLENNFDLGTKIKDGKEEPVYWMEQWGFEEKYLMLGGYADFTQTDPRGYNARKDQTECLFKIDSCYSETLNIGDAGIMVGLISPDDLKNGNISNTFTSWDCC